MIRVRRATEADIGAMSVVLIASITRLCAADHHDDAAAIAHWTRNKSPDGVRAMLANPTLALYVAERDGAIAAVGGFIGDEIVLTYTAPEHRFVGAARALMATMEAELRRRGHTSARLSSSVTARRFYEDGGWTGVGVPGVDYSTSGYPMTKRL